MRDTFVGLGGWLKNSFIDFPGTVSTVLFFSGCNLRCPYCHNPDLVAGRNDLSSQSDQIWSFLQRRKGMIDGVVFSGGEPTIHPHVPTLCHQIRDMGYKIKLDSNGLLPKVVEKSAPDYFALDIKTTPSLYYRLGASYGDISHRLGQSIELVKSMGEKAEVRITVAPTLIDMEVVQELSEMLKGVTRVFLQPLNQRVPLLSPHYNSIKSISEQEIEQYRHMLSFAVGSCKIR
ncbi:MAG: anaerobic ribonucleoside-triphosphate reductase activating protein [Chitinispirillaceae bacterium]